MKTYSFHSCKAVLLSGMILMCSVPVAAQDKIDSLKNLISVQPENEQKTDNLLALAQAFADKIALDSADFYAREALALSTKIGYRIGIAESNYKLYLIEFKRGNLQAAIAYVSKFNEIIGETDDEARLGKGLFSYGVLLGKQGKIDSSLFYIHKSLDINKKLNDTMRLIATYNSIGGIYTDKALHDSAAYYFLKSIQLAEASGMVKYLGTLYTNLGKAFTRLKDHDKARYYLDLALEINLTNKDVKTTAQNYINLGNNSLSDGKVEEALQFYDQAAELVRRLGDELEQANLYNNYAFAFELQGNRDLALENYRKALISFQKQDYTAGITMAMKNIGQIFWQKGQYEMAQVYFDSALNIATRAGYLENRRLILWGIAQNKYSAGKYKEAYDYYNTYFVLYDSMLSVDKVKALNELEKKYQKEKDQAMILSLEKENLKKTIQRNFITYGALVILMLAVFLILYFRQRARKDRIISEQKIRQLEEEKKLMAARLVVEGQEEERKRIAMELHDGLGVLLSATKMQFTTIKDLNPENQSLIERATKLLEEASGDVRRISHNMMPGLLTRLGFFEAVEDLIDNVGEMQDLNATCEIEGDKYRMAENKEIMLYRVVQEMVNNTLKHAQAKNIRLKIKTTSTELFLTYSDDGMGFEPDKYHGSGTESIGLKSIRSRVDFLNGQADLETAPGKGTRYTIRVPL